VEVLEGADDRDRDDHPGRQHSHRRHGPEALAQDGGLGDGACTDHEGHGNLRR